MYLVSNFSFSLNNITVTYNLINLLTQLFQKYVPGTMLCIRNIGEYELHGTWPLGICETTEEGNQQFVFFYFLAK